MYVLPVSVLSTC